METAKFLSRAADFTTSKYGVREDCYPRSGVPELPKTERPGRNRRNPPGLNAAQARSRSIYEAEADENNGLASTFCNDGCNVGHKRKTGQKARVS